MHNTGTGPCGPCGGKCKYAKGGDVQGVEEMKVPEKDMGEVSDDSEIHDACAQELMDSLEKKDKQGVLDAIKAIVLSMGDK